MQYIKIEYGFIYHKGILKLIGAFPIAQNVILVK